jgi:hypothetical protein
VSLFRLSLQQRRTVWHVFFDRSLQCCNLIAAPHGLMLHSLLDLVVQAQNHMAQISFLLLDNTPPVPVHNRNRIFHVSCEFCLFILE